MKIQMRRVTILAALLSCQLAHSMDLVPGDIYSSNYSSSTIRHYSKTGSFVDSYDLSSTYGSSVRGLAFGDNGYLYATTIRGSDFGVVALDSSGTVRESYDGQGYAQGNIGYGKIAFGTAGRFFVSVQDTLVSFTQGQSGGTVIYNENQVHDAELLPNGNLLVLSAYGLKEITQTGGLVRSIDPSVSLVDAQGVEYDAASDSIYVSMLGFTGEEFRLMKINGATGFVEKRVSFNYAGDLFLTAENQLLVASRTQVPRVYDLDLNQVGVVGNMQQMFITQNVVPEPATIAVVGAGLLALRRRRARK